MLAAFAFAINAAENAVPDTAPAAFQAGFFNTFLPTHPDLRAQFSACFKPDQNLADHTDAFIAALAAHDWATVKSTVTELEPEAVVDAAVCHTDPQYKAVDDAYSAQEDAVKAARADPDWQLKLLKAIRGNMSDIKADSADA